MARVILVHGAWHGGWCWEEIVPRLAALGHQVMAPDLPGMGSDAVSGHVASLDEWAMYIAGMAAASSQPAVLVGHSRGGIVISRAAEFAPSAISKLIYLAAVMVRPGETMMDPFNAAPELSAPHAAGAFTVADDGLTSIWHDPQAAVRAFYGTTPEHHAAAAFDRLTPEPTSMGATRIDLTEERYGSIPRAYIYCERDASLVPALQRRMVEAHPCVTRTMDTDHSPFYSAPVDLTRTIDELVSL